MRHKLLIATLIATLAAALPANACELICMKTTVKYDGNLGGLTGADAKCAAEYTGFKFARTATMADAFMVGITRDSSGYVPLVRWGQTGFNVSATNPDDAVSFTAYGWAGATLGAAGGTYDCSAWTSNSSGVYGGSLGGNIGGIMGYSTNAAACNLSQQLVCCNM